MVPLCVPVASQIASPVTMVNTPPGIVAPLPACRPLLRRARRANATSPKPVRHAIAGFGDGNDHAGRTQMGVFSFDRRPPFLAGGRR